MGNKKRLKLLLAGVAVTCITALFGFNAESAKADVMGDWVYENYEYEIVVTGYTGSATEVVVPDYINGKRVACLKGTFYQNNNIQGVYVPSTVERMEADYSTYPIRSVFGECGNLRSVSGCDNVYAFAEGTFRECKSLGSVNIPKANSIPGQMFYNCRSLKSISIPRSAQFIDYQAFEGCESLVTVKGGTGAKRYGTRAFQDCKSLKNITLGNAQSIASYMFYNCNKLQKIKIPNTVTNIQKGAFARTGLKVVRIPDSVQYIGGDLYDPAYSLANGAFANCANLKKVLGCKNLMTCGKAVFHNCKKLERVSLGKVGYITKDMFKNCESLTSISIPSTVRSINDNAFYKCKKLKAVKLPPKLETIRSGAFAGCKSLKDVKIPKKVTRVYEDSFCGKISLKVYKGSAAAKVFPKAKKI